MFRTAAVLSVAFIVPCVADAADLEASSPVSDCDEICRREEGTHLAVRLEAPLTGVGKHGITLFGVNVSLRRDWLVGEMGLRAGSQMGEGEGILVDLRGGTSIGYYGRYGGVRANLTGGVATTSWRYTHEYIGSEGTLFGAGGEASLGYISLGGFEVRLALGLYRTVAGELEAYDEGNARPDVFGQAGLAVGYEL